MTTQELQNEIRHLPLKEKYQLFSWFAMFIMLEQDDRQAQQFEKITHTLYSIERRMESLNARINPD